MSYVVGADSGAGRTPDSRIPDTFYATKLSDEKKSVTWGPDPYPSSKDGLMSNRLVIRQVILDHKAAADEYNVVQVETQGADDAAVKTVIAVLKVGETRSISVDLELCEQSVTFRLIEGKGPVHINGHVLLNFYTEDMDDGEEMEEEMVEDEDEDDEKPPPEKKAKVAATNNAGGKTAAGKGAGAKNNNKKK